jgi:hypothetical protein
VVVPAVGEFLWGLGTAPTAVKLLFQDNKSAIEMERNGRSWHIDIHYFFIIDHSKCFNRAASHWAIAADFFTKRNKYWSVLLGHNHIVALPVCSTEQLAQEHVKTQNQNSAIAWLLL